MSDVESPPIFVCREEAARLLGGISVRRPTLDDVFLSLTGRQIREEGAEGQFARLRAIARRRG